MIAANPSIQSNSFSAGLSGFADAQALPLTWDNMVEHRDYLVRFAKRKLQDPSQAEDVVHDVFEAVISGRALFSGRAALRSWLTAVLKNKIVDTIRHSVRFDSFDHGGSSEDGDDDQSPQTVCGLAKPDELAEQRQRLQQTMARISTLPQGLRDVMQFRVLEDETSEAVCQRLSISEASLFVRLHRARKQLLC